MANQIIIDIGAAANDGTGDPLRTAFNYVNNNFSNVWATGVANSNISFSGNKILTTNTNGNLVLAPNGIGKVASNVDIVPNTANVFALGSSTRRWNTVYGQYLNLSHNATIGGNLVVTGDITGGNIHYTGNVFVGDLEGSVFDGASSIVLDVINSSIYVDNYYYANGVPFSGGGTPGGANTQIQFNDGGVFGGSAAFVFDKTSNVMSIAGNVSAGNIAVANLTSTSTIYGTTGTFTGDQYSDGAVYIGNPAGTVLGSDVVIQITANAGGYSQTNFQNISNAATASGDYILTADNGNDTTHYLDLGMTSSGWDGSETNVLAGLVANNGYLYVQDGNLSLGVRNGSTSYKWNFDTTGNLTVAGNVLPTGNNTQSLGSATRQWNDLYLSNATIYMNSVPIGLTSGNVLTVNGANVVTATAGGNIDVNNIVSGSNIAIDTSAEKVTVSVGTSDWVFDETGVLTAPGEIETVGNISAGYFLGNGSQLTGITGNLDFVGTDISIAAGAPDTLINISPSGEGWAYLQLPKNASANSANTRLHNDAGNVEIGTGDFSTGSSSYEWIFTNTGNLNLPTNGSINVNSGSIVQTPDENLKIVVQDAEDDGWALQLEVTDGTTVGSRIEQTVDQIQIGTGLAGTSYYWQFDDLGRLSVPGDIWGTYNGNLSVLARGVTDSSFVEIATQDNSDIKRSNLTVTRDNVTVTTSSGAYNWTFDVNGDLIVPGGNTEIYVGNAVGNVAGNSISITGGDADQTAYYATPGGNVNITGGLGAFNDGGGGGQGGSVNISSGLSADPAGVAGNINITAGSGTMVFDYGGNLTVSGSILTDNIRTIEGAVHVGQGAGLTNQGTYGIAVGRFAGSQDQSSAALAIGQLAGQTGQGQTAIALGLYSGATTQSANAVSIGTYAGQITQGTSAVAIGREAATDQQGANAVAIGTYAGYQDQGTSAIAIGREAGNSSQGALAVAIGTWAGNASQGGYSVAIGPSAGANTQGDNSVAIGVSAARETQGDAAIAIGQGSGTISQGAHGIAIGDQAGQQTQAANAIAIGTYAGYESAGLSSISIGTGAGYYIANNSIVINATGANLNGNTANTFTVAPVRNDVANIGQVMFYNTTSNEVTYGNTISVAGNISSGNVSVTGNITGNTAGYAIGYRDIPQVLLESDGPISADDSGKHLYGTSSTDYTLNILDSGIATYPVGTAITIVNRGTANIILYPYAGVSLYLAGTNTSGNRTVGSYGMATLLNVDTDVWMINGTGVY